jgi:hypothetical protein
MSSRAPAWFEQKYVNGAIHKLQDSGYRLQGTTTVTDQIIGKTVIWKIAGRGEATEMSGSIEERPVMNADRQTVEGTMKDYEANEWINRMDLNKMSESEQQVAQMTAAMAMGRRFDKNIMSVMDKAGSAITTIGNGSAVMDITHPMEASAKILAQGFAAAPELYLPIPQMVMLQLELYKQFSSSDYVGNQPMMKLIGARTYKGVTYIPLPDEMFAVPSSGQFDTYLYQKAAVGHVPNMALESRIDYQATKKAWFAGNTVASAEAVLLPEGIRRLRFQLPTELSLPAELVETAA